LLHQNDFLKRIGEKRASVEPLRNRFVVHHLTWTMEVRFLNSDAPITALALQALKVLAAQGGPRGGAAMDLCAVLV